MHFRWFVQKIRLEKVNIINASGYSEYKANPPSYTLSWAWTSIWNNKREFIFAKKGYQGGGFYIKIIVRITIFWKEKLNFLRILINGKTDNNSGLFAILWIYQILFHPVWEWFCLRKNIFLKKTSVDFSLRHDCMEAELQHNF